MPGQHLLFDSIHRPHRRSVTWVLAGVGALVVLGGIVLTLTLWGCQTHPLPPQAPRANLRQVDHEPVVRIRVAKCLPQVQLAGASAVYFQLSGQAPGRTMLPVTVTWSTSDHRATIRLLDGRALPVLSSVTIWAEEDQPLLFAKRLYPGRLVIHRRQDADGLDVVNHLNIEAYLPGVLDRELFSHWHDVTYQAQSIAARSYAIAHLSRTAARRFDLESTQASQVYHGQTHNAKALRAVLQTRGMVLMYRDQVVPAYYSSCTGGTGQDAAAAFGDAPDIAPLRGRDQGDLGRASRYYRWGPVQRNLTTLSLRLAAWGTHRSHDIARLTRMRMIEITQRNSPGRPTRFTIYDDSGQTFALGPEAFRFACNFTAEGTLPLASDLKLRSGHVTIQVEGNAVHFTDGRGWGHGVGMGQYGAQAMARQGESAETILAFYYPEAQLVRAY